MFRGFLKRLKREFREELMELELIPPRYTDETTVRVYKDTHAALKLLQKRLGCRSLDMVIRRLIRADVPLEILVEASRACLEATRNTHTAAEQV